jgi:hypothetical protein
MPQAQTARTATDSIEDKSPPVLIFLCIKRTCNRGFGERVWGEGGKIPRFETLEKGKQLENVIFEYLSALSI